MAALARRHTAVAAVGATALTAATTWAAQTSGARLFAASGRDLGSGALATGLAILGWDAIYYWNHRLSHESRWLWAVHVAHHSSERYNLSTALRQPVAEGLTLSVPYGLDRLFGTFEPEGAPVVYGLTTNINSFNPIRIATHEWRDIAQTPTRSPSSSGRSASARATQPRPRRFCRARCAAPLTRTPRCPKPWSS